MNIFKWIAEHDDKIIVTLYRIDDDTFIKMQTDNGKYKVARELTRKEMESADYSGTCILQSMLDELCQVGVRV